MEHERESTLVKSRSSTACLFHKCVNDLPFITFELTSFNEENSKNDEVRGGVYMNYFKNILSPLQTGELLVSSKCQTEKCDQSFPPVKTDCTLTDKYMKPTINDRTVLDNEANACKNLEHVPESLGQETKIKTDYEQRLGTTLVQTRRVKRERRRFSYPTPTQIANLGSCEPRNFTKELNLSKEMNSPQFTQRNCDEQTQGQSIIEKLLATQCDIGTNYSLTQIIEAAESTVICVEEGSLFGTASTESVNSRTFDSHVASEESLQASTENVLFLESKKDCATANTNAPNQHTEGYMRTNNFINSDNVVGKTAVEKGSRVGSRKEREKTENDLSLRFLNCNGLNTLEAEKTEQERDLNKKMFINQEFMPSETKCVGFSTAGGKIMTVSDQILKKVEHFWACDEQDVLARDVDEKLKMDKVKSLRNDDTDNPKKRVKFCDENINTSMPTTLPKGGVSVSPNAVQKKVPIILCQPDKTIRGETIERFLPLKQQDLTFPGLDNTNDTSKDILPANFLVERAKYFVDNSCKEVNIESRHRPTSPKAVVNENVMTTYDKESKLCKRTGHNKHRRIENESFWKQELSNRSGTTLVGFSTAAGKKVAVSEMLLQKVKGLWDQKDGMELSNANSIKDEELVKSQGVIVTELQMSSDKENYLCESKMSRIDAKDIHAKQELPKVGGSTFVGFSTAAGKKVVVSEMLLQKVKGLWDQQDGIESSDANSVKGQDLVCESKMNRIDAKDIHAKQELPKFGGSTFVGFSTAAGKKVAVSEKLLTEVRNSWREQDNKITVSEQNANSLEVENLFQTVTKDQEEAVIKEKNLVEENDPSENMSRMESETLNHHVRQELPKNDESTFVGFSTAAGKKVAVSEKLLKEVQNTWREQDLANSLDVGDLLKTAKQVLKEILRENEVPSVEENDARKRTSKKRSRKEIETSVKQDFPKISGSMFVGFSTAAGKKVAVSEKILKEVQNTWSEQDVLKRSVNDQDANCLRVDDLLRTITKVNQKALTKKENNSFEENPFKKMRTRPSRNEFENSDHQDELPISMCGSSVVGFSTAAGKKVAVSEKILKDVKNIWSEQDVKRPVNDLDSNSSQVEDTLSKTCLYMQDADILKTDQITTPGTEEENELDHKYKEDSRVNGRVAGNETLPTCVLVNKLPKQSNSSEDSSSTGGILISKIIPKEVHASLNEVTPLEGFKPRVCEKWNPLMKFQSHSKGKTLFIPPFKDRNRGSELRSGELSKKQKSVGLQKRVVPGKLWQLRNESRSTRLKFSVAVNGQKPKTHSLEDLLFCGIDKFVAVVNARNATNFRFGSQFFKTKNSDLIIDDTRLELGPDGGAGKDELYKAFLTKSGVDSSLIDERWFGNHYRWIVWKLAAMEVSFPDEFGGRCLTPCQLMMQMKYRYDREIDRSERSALSKIFERDDVASKMMVLCVSGIQENEGEIKMELTDGWYPIFSNVDRALKDLVLKNKICVGQKLVVCGAELVGSDEACSALDAPESLTLRIWANSTRRARWDAKLGFVHSSRPMEVPLSSVFPEGGLVSCIRCIVNRVYPVQYLEKYGDGSVIIRNTAGEEKASREYEKLRRKSIDSIIEHVQQERCNTGLKKPVGRQKKTAISSLGTGQELFEAMEASEDPSAFQDSLTSHQIALLMDYKERTNNDVMQEELRKAVASDEKFPKERCVVSLLKVKISGIRDERSVMFTVWRPSDDLLQLFREGNALRIHHLLPRHSKFKDSVLEMNSTKNTRYESIEIDKSVLRKIYTPRSVARIGYPEVGSEIDVVGVVFHVSASTSPFQDVYLSDSELNILCIRIWCGVKRLHAENILCVGNLVCATNLKVRQATLPHTAYANEVSAFTVKPKPAYLQAAVSVFPSKDITKIVKLASERLLQRLELKRPSVVNVTPPPPRYYPTYSPLCLRKGVENKLEQNCRSAAKERISRLERYDSALPLPELRITSSRKALRNFKPPVRVKTTPNRTSPPMDLD